MERIVRYYASGDQVLPGDRVTSKGWFFTKNAEIVYVPGISAFNKWFHEEDLTYCGVRLQSGSVFGAFIYPETGLLKESIRFVARGEPAAYDLSELDEE